MKRAKHPASETLEDFVNGHLMTAEVEAVVDHLSECEACLAIADRLWSQHLDGEIPDLSQEVAGRIEDNLRRRIHRSELGGQATRLGTQGLLLVWWALLRPLFGRRLS